MWHISLGWLEGAHSSADLPVCLMIQHLFVHSQVWGWSSSWSIIFCLHVYDFLNAFTACNVDNVIIIYRSCIPLCIHIYQHCVDISSSNGVLESVVSYPCQDFWTHVVVQNDSHFHHNHSCSWSNSPYCFCFCNWRLHSYNFPPNICLLCRKPRCRILPFHYGLLCCLPNWIDTDSTDNMETHWFNYLSDKGILKRLHAKCRWYHNN